MTTAKCGRTDPHGSHAYTFSSPIGDKNGWCAGNVNIVDSPAETGETSPAGATMAPTVKQHVNETYGAILIRYAEGVEAGQFDRDLDDDARVYVGRLLRAAAGSGAGSIIYPPSDRTRDDVSTVLHQAYRAGSIGVNQAGEASWHLAIVRAADIVRNV